MQRAVAKLLPQGNGVSKCQARSLPDGNGGHREIEVKKVDGSAYLNGVLSCGSVWMCPLCSPKILVRRAADIDVIMEVAKKRRATVLFVTLTCRHHAFDSPEFTVKLVSGAFGKLLRGRDWAGHTGKERERRIEAGKPVSGGKRGDLAYIGMTRVMEVNHGPNGYHPHIHAGLVFERELTDAEILGFRLWLFDKWNQYLASVGAKAVTWENGVDVKRWETADHLGNYVTKIGHGWSLSSELTAGDEKEARHSGHYNTAQLVRRYVEEGESEEVADVLRGMYRATKGKRMMYTSPALRKWANLGEEKSDEELANEDVQGVGLVSLAPELYGWLRRLWAIADVLTAAEKRGAPGIIEHCEAIGLPVILYERECSGLDEGRAPPLPRLAFDRSRWRP